MAAVAARELRDGEVVFVGIGLPNLACNLARATHAPNLVLIYESGAVGAVPERLPVSIGDPSLVTGSLMVCGMADVFQSLLQNGRIEVGFLGGAQIDRYGNINTTVVGSYDHPDGAPAGQRRRRRDRHSRAAHGRDQPAQPAGISRGGGLRHQPRPPRARAHPARAGHARRRPVKVVTDKAILEADADDRRAGAGRALSRRRGGRGARRHRLAAPVRAPRSRRSSRRRPSRAAICCATCSIPIAST